MVGGEENESMGEGNESTGEAIAAKAKGRNMRAKTNIWASEDEKEAYFTFHAKRAVNACFAEYAGMQKWSEIIAAKEKAMARTMRANTNK